MGKTMARIKDGIIVNMEWCSLSVKESDNLKDPNGRFVNIGDTYDNGKFYHDGVEVLTSTELLEKENEDMKNAFNILGI